MARRAPNGVDRNLEAAFHEKGPQTLPLRYSDPETLPRTQVLNILVITKKTLDARQITLHRLGTPGESYDRTTEKVKVMVLATTLGYLGRFNLIEETVKYETEAPFTGDIKHVLPQTEP